MDSNHKPPYQSSAPINIPKKTLSNKIPNSYEMPNNPAEEEQIKIHHAGKLFLEQKTQSTNDVSSLPDEINKIKKR